MTCRDKLKMEHPENINPKDYGGCGGCPSTYGYLDDPHYCGDDNYGMDREKRCTMCWDREIPEGVDIPKNKFPIYPIYTEAEKELLEHTDALWPKDNPNLSDSIKKAGENAAKAVGSVSALASACISSIKDSGDRTQFETGAVRDMREGKGRCDLMPLEVVGNVLHDDMFQDLKSFLNSMDTAYLYRSLVAFSKAYDDGKTKASLEEIVTQRNCTMFLEVAKHFEEGAKKYGENNWQKGIPVHCYIDSAVRHYLKWLRGDNDEPHDRAFVWNIMCCIWEVDYRPKEET